LADSDEEEDDAGDSTLETRRSVKFVENQLKQRWFINAQEKRSFEKKVAAGLIRPEVLDFTDKSDSDPQASAKEVIDKEVSKKKAADEAEEKAVAKKAEQEADKKKDPKEKEAEEAEKADAENKEAASKKLAEEEEKLANKEAGKSNVPEDKPAKKEEAAAEEDFIPPELMGAM
jgi:hypothetical protein